jgi:hypothetical protein
MRLADSHQTSAAPIAEVQVSGLSRQTKSTVKVSTGVAHHDMGTVAIAAALSGHVSLVDATLAFAWLAA